MFYASWLTICRIGGAAGNPADIINVRMQQDRANPPAQRRNYRNAIDGIVRKWFPEFLLQSWSLLMLR